MELEERLYTTSKAMVNHTEESGTLLIEHERLFQEALGKVKTPEVRKLYTSWYINYFGGKTTGLNNRPS
jgi:hypothetical protein